jgi:hypothetical protein
MLAAPKGPAADKKVSGIVILWYSQFKAAEAGKALQLLLSERRTPAKMQEHLFNGG